MARHIIAITQGPIMTWSISLLDRSRESLIRQHIDQKTKPLGALGQLESLALQLALIQQQETIKVEHPTLFLFAGDHGVARHGVSIVPSEVTHQMVLNFLAGGAASNCICRSNGMEMVIIDAGILTPVEQPGVIEQRLGAGTHDLSMGPAMTMAQAEQGLRWGAKIVRAHAARGCNVVAFGEMGIGNTTPAAALLAAMTSHPVVACVGRGTGIDDATLARKCRLVEQALERIEGCQDPLTLLAEVGGFEIAQITGGILAAAEAGMAILVDGFIITAAAMLAVRMAPACREYLIFAHGSAEGGHALMLQDLEATPLLDLGLRLGEGTGAALALPLLRAACAFYNDMATFASAGVTA